MPASPNDQAEETPEPLYWERRPLSVTTIGVFAALAIAFPSGLFQAVREGTPLSSGLLPALAAMVLLIGSAAFVSLGPFGVEFKHVRVDQRGLWVGRRLIPVHEIGRFEALSAAEAKEATIRWRHDGIKIGRGSYNPIGTDGAAVFVVRRRSGVRRPGMVVATKDPEAVMAAMKQLKGRIS